MQIQLRFYRPNWKSEEVLQYRTFIGNQPPYNNNWTHWETVPHVCGMEPITQGDTHTFDVQQAAEGFVPFGGTD